MDFTVTYMAVTAPDYGYFSYDNTTQPCDEEELWLQGFYTVFRPVLYSLIFLLGLAGNGLMVAVLLGPRRRLRISEIYLLHLAVADLMLIFTLPFHLVESITSWIFGDFFCMLTGVLRNLNLLCGSFLLACIGFDRYLAIVHAIPSMRSRRPKRVHLMCGSLWLICLLLSLPNAVFLSVTKILHHVSFFVSLVVMCYCYTALVITLFKSQKSQAKKGAIRLALLVTVVFCFCWLPHNITSLLKTLEDLEITTDVSCRSRALLNQVDAVTESLGISHCCLNPFLYAFVGVQFRNELLHLLCRLGCRRCCLGFIRAQDYRPSVSDGTTSNNTIMY
ncbi:hypothetical protein ATANTOWER_005493 [Ataeniobius toweri]|uniref:G-protein coupled receptors family 1 profile domain-containing protein n=1 Tax=Ataeniobius toweri TaxID=208326 RepID=A0ABU7CEQ3_9TELE|nr:hypothetical protein [Ataeniobius toweri]